VAASRKRWLRPDSSGQLFLDARRLAAALAQVVQLGAAHVAAALDFDLAISGL
jgi:hypothetical protein